MYLDIEKVVVVVEILTFIGEDGGRTVSEIESKFKINRKSLYRYLNAWEKEKYIVRIKLNRGQRNESRFRYKTTTKTRKLLKRIDKKI